ncbi:MAG: sulfatase [Acidobacteria bacterium]|nr:sulfatase [Acidobacteriota bacterium]
MRFQATVFCLLILAATLCSSCSHPEPAADTRPNVVFILLDDVRWDDLGAGGHPWVQTPNFDRVAHEGALFTNAFATTPLCSPNRASLLTGQYAHTHGITDNVDRSEQSHQLMTFPRLLHDAGYETAFIGKWHMGVDDSPRPGFDYWYSLQGQGYHFDPDVNENGVRKKVQGYTTDIFDDRAVEFVRKQREQPFLLYLSHKVVHPNIFQNADGSPDGPRGGAEKYTPAPRHVNLYADKVIPRRPNTASYGKDKPALQRPIPGVTPLGPDSGTDDATILNRLRMLSSADEGMGDIFKALEETGKLDNTVVVVTSDHGYFYSEHGLGRERRLAYEESIRVPLYIRYPSGISAGTKINDFALSVDDAPTMLDFAGLETPDNMHGRSLGPLLAGETPADWRKSFLIEYYSDTVMPRLVKMGYKAVRTENWKYINYVDLEDVDELYNLESDPYEMNNLIGDTTSKDTLNELKTELAHLLEQTGPVTY